MNCEIATVGATIAGIGRLIWRAHRLARITAGQNRIGEPGSP